MEGFNNSRIYIGEEILNHTTISHMVTFLYNQLPNDIENKNPKRLSKYLQENIDFYFPFTRIDNYDPG